MTSYSGRVTTGVSILEKEQACDNAVDYFESGVKKRKYYELSTIYYDYCIGKTGNINSYTRSSIYAGEKRGRGLTSDELVWLVKRTNNGGGVVDKFAIGLMYLNGYTLPKDREMALVYLTLAARGGHGHAQMQLALTLIEIDEIDNALLWLELAAKNNYPGADDMLTTIKLIYGN